MSRILEQLKKITGNILEESQVRMMNPLVLAYIGAVSYTHLLIGFDYFHSLLIQHSKSSVQVT